MSVNKQQQAPRYSLLPLVYIQAEEHYIVEVFIRHMSNYKVKVKMEAIIT